MAKKHLLAAALVASSLLVAPQATLAHAHHWTITQRQQALLAEIDSARRANNLTLKEADTMKEEHDKILRHEAAMKAKNGGKLSQEDDTKLEKELNTLSNKLHKRILEKRVQ